MKRLLHRLAAFGAVALVAVACAPSTPAAHKAGPVSPADAAHPQVMQEVSKSLALGGSITPGNLAAYSDMRGNLGTAVKAPTTSVAPLQREVFGFAFGN